MESKHAGDSEEKLKKATEFLWKFWWFSFYLVIAPFVISLIFWALIRYIIFIGFTQDLFIVEVYSFALALIVAVFSILFFYKAFDKYRKRPFFDNRLNNLSARIHVLFIISIGALFITPIFLFSTPENYGFELLPIISYAIIFNITWYYFYYQPIDEYARYEVKFVHSINKRLTLSRLHNLVVIFNYIVHLIFLSLIFYTKISWLFALITDIIFYTITYFYGKSERKKVQANLKENVIIVEELLQFQKKHVMAVSSLIFALLIQMPIIILTIPQQGIAPEMNDILVSIFLVSLFALFYVKTRLNVSLHYSYSLNKLVGSFESDNNSENVLHMKRINSMISSAIIGVVLLFVMLLNMPWIILVSLPFLYGLFFFEERYHLIHEKYHKYVNFLNSIALLLVISFLLIPLISNLITWNIQLIIFLFLLYFTLEIFVKRELFSKESTLIIQNFLAITIFSLIIFSFFPLISSEFLLYTTDPIDILISDITLSALFISIISLISLYRLYHVFYKKYNPKIVINVILINILVIQFLFFFLIDFRAYFIYDPSLYSSLVFASIISSPLIFLGALFLNYFVGIIPPKMFLKYCYYIFWVMLSILMTLTIIFLNFSIIIRIIACLLIGSIGYSSITYFGTRIEKVDSVKFEKTSHINAYLIVLETYLLIFLLSVLVLDVLFSLYYPLVLISILVYGLASYELFFTKEFSTKLNAITLFFSAIIVAYYSILVTSGTYYLFILPSMFTSLVLILPLIFLIRKGILTKLANKALIVDVLVLFVSIALIPGIISLELSVTGILMDTISTLNFTLYILLGLLSITIYAFKRIQNLDEFIGHGMTGMITILIILTGTTFFYYPYIMFTETSYSIVLPLIIASCYFFLPSYLIFKKEKVSQIMARRILLSNAMFLSSLIITLPTFIGLQLITAGVENSLPFTLAVVTITAGIIFGLFYFMEWLSVRIKVNQIYLIYLKLSQITLWTIIAGLIGGWISSLLSYFVLLPLFNYSTGLLAFFCLLMLNKVNTESLRRLAVDRNTGKFTTIKVLKREDHYYNFMYLGLQVSLSGFLMSLFPILGLNGLLREENAWVLPIYLGCIFFGSLLVINQIIMKRISFRYWKFTKHVKWISWSYLNAFFSLYLTALIFYNAPITDQIMSYVLLFCLFAPISLHLLRASDIDIKKHVFSLKVILINCFLISLSYFYIRILLHLFTFSIYLNFDWFTSLVILTCNLFLLLNTGMKLSKRELEKHSELELYKIFWMSAILFIMPLQFFPSAQYLWIILSCFFFLPWRNKNVKVRYAHYVIFALLVYLGIIREISMFSLISGFEYIAPGFYVLIFLGSLLIALGGTILLNLKKNHYLEFITIYLILSAGTFVFIFSFTNILLLYNITITAFVFLLFTGIHLYLLDNPRYQWFIKPCILLFAFDFTSWISYSFLFLHPIHALYNPFLTFTLTMSVSSVVFLVLYKNSSDAFRDKSFKITLSTAILSIPAFLYCLMLSYFPIQVEPAIAFIIAANVGVFLFYFSIGVYKWELSRAIWKTGWWMWNVLPLLNFLLIYRIIEGIDVYSNTLKVFGELDLIVFTLLISTLIELPALYTWIKDHFYKILLIVWGESLYLIYYIALNIFIDNLILVISFFCLFAVVANMPILYKLSKWEVVSITWLVVGGLNILFVHFLLYFTNGLLAFIISIDVVIAGLFLMVYSYFPNIKAKEDILLGSYFTVFSGIYFAILFSLFAVIGNLLISINIAFIIIAFSLFSAKYVNLDKEKMHALISLLLIVNFSWLTFNTFSLIPGFELFALFLSFTVAGGTTFISIQYNMIPYLNKGIPWMIMGISAAASVSSLLFILLEPGLFLLIAVFLSISLAFIYFVDEQGYLLMIGIPFPLVLITLDLLFAIEVVQTFSILFWMLIFSLYFHSTIYVFKILIEGNRLMSKTGLMTFFADDTKIKTINLVFFLLNSTYACLLITIFSPWELPFLILQFLLIWSISTLACLKYVHVSELDLSLTNAPLLLNLMGSLLYTLIFASSMSIFILITLFMELDIMIFIPLFICVSFGIYFSEIYVIDGFLLRFLKNRSYLGYSFISWFVFCNSGCVLLFILNVDLFLVLFTASLLNLMTLRFLKPLMDSKQSIVSLLQLMLIFSSFLTISFYAGSLTSGLIAWLFSDLAGIPTLLVFLLVSFVLIFTFNHLFNKKIDPHQKNWIEFILFSTIQVLLFVFLAVVFSIFEILNFFTINLLIFIELRLSFILIHYIYLLFLIDKSETVKSTIRDNIHFASMSVLCLTCLGGLLLVLGVLESVILSLILLFMLSFRDVSSSKIQLKYESIINTISYFALTLLLFVYAYQFAIVIPDLILLNWIFFLLLQFGTIYCAINAYKQYNPSKAEKLSKSSQFKTIRFDYLLFILSLGCIYFAGLFSNLIITFNRELLTDLRPLMSAMFSALFIFLMSQNLKKAEQERFRYYFEILTFMVFQALLAVLWFTGCMRLTLTNLFFITFGILIVLCTMFYTNHVVFKVLSMLNADKKDTFEKRKGRIQEVLGVLFYGIAIFLIQNLFMMILMLPLYQVLFLSLIIHGVVILDRYTFKFLKKSSKYLGTSSYASAVISFLIVLTIIYTALLPSTWYSVIPLILMISVLSVPYFLKMLIVSQVMVLDQQKAKKRWLALLYIISSMWPLFFLRFDALINLILITLSLGIALGILIIDKYISTMPEEMRYRLLKMDVMAMGSLISAQIGIWFYLVTINVPFSTCIALLVFSIFLGFIIKPFKGHSLVTLVYWISVFVLGGLTLYFLEIPFGFGLTLIIIGTLIYPFIFLLEEMREFFSKLAERLIEIWEKVKQAFQDAWWKVKTIVRKVYVGISGFLKRHFKPIWIAFSLFLSILSYILLTTYLFLGFFSAVLISIAIFGLLYSVIPSKKSDDPDEIFKKRFIRLIIIWGSVIMILFNFIPVQFTILMIFISIIIVGAIILIFIKRQEEQEKISIRWRFYSTLFFIIIFFLTMTLLILQLTGIIIVG